MRWQKDPPRRSLRGPLLAAGVPISCWLPSGGAPRCCSIFSSTSRSSAVLSCDLDLNATRGVWCRRAGPKQLPRHIRLTRACGQGDSFWSDLRLRTRARGCAHPVVECDERCVPRRGFDSVSTSSPAADGAPPCCQLVQQRLGAAPTLALQCELRQRVASPSDNPDRAGGFCSATLRPGCVLSVSELGVRQLPMRLERIPSLHDRSGLFPVRGPFKGLVWRSTIAERDATLLRVGAGKPSYLRRHHFFLNDRCGERAMTVVPRGHCFSLRPCCDQPCRRRADSSSPLHRSTASAARRCSTCPIWLPVGGCTMTQPTRAGFSA